MSANRRIRLGHEEAWERGFAALKKFKAREGHCQVQQSHLEGTFRLGQWVSVQRELKNKIAANRKRRLDAVGFVWDDHERNWEKGFAALQKFKAREGHCQVPQSHLEGTLKLGQWVNVQRRFKDRIATNRKRRLALKKFKARKGHCLVPNCR